MVEDTTARLVASGVAPDRILGEAFAASRPSPDVDGGVTE
jgi:hypothetical protein